MCGAVRGKLCSNRQESQMLNDAFGSFSRLALLNGSTFAYIHTNDSARGALVSLDDFAEIPSTGLITHHLFLFIPFVLVPPRELRFQKRIWGSLLPGRIPVIRQQLGG